MKILRGSILSIAILFSFSLGESNKLKQIHQKFSTTFKNTKIQSIKESPIKNLYEVVLENGNIIYTDGNYLFIGHIYNFIGQDLTQKRIDEITTNKQIDKIDLSKALKIGSGKTKVIEILDPEDVFSRKSEKFFENKDVTRYIFFMPLSFHEKAKEIAIHILCSDNKEEEYKKAMIGILDVAATEEEAKINVIARMVNEGIIDTLIYCKKGEEQLKQMEEVVKQLKVEAVPVFWVETEGGWKKIKGANPQILKYLTKKEK